MSTSVALPVSPDTWPPNLRTMVALAQRAPVPMQVWWGTGLTIVADNHSRFPDLRMGEMTGARASEAWSGMWGAIGGSALSILAGGPGQSHEFRSLTVSLCPIAGDGEGSLPGGVLVTSQVSAAGGEDARTALVEANRAKDEFLAMLGHELRNPLAPIATALQLLTIRSGGEGARERAVIQRQVTHLTRLVDDLLDVSRITRGKLQLDLQELAIDDVISKAIEIAGPVIEKRNQRLILDLSTNGTAVRGDPVRLAQVLANLLTNSAKYTNVGGRIEVSTRVVGSHVEIRVCDDGIGIAPEVLPRLFEPFSQERQALDRSQGGLGLGLAIVKGLVRAHGGTVAAFSMGRHRGSQFTVLLPVSQGVVGERDETTTETVLRSGTKAKILVVDDNRDAAMLLSELLREHGHDVRMSFDGFDALRIARGFLPHIILLDLGLPIVDGYEICRKIRADGSLFGTKVVALTGYGNPEAQKRTQQSGFDGHLLKPVAPQRLEELIATLAS